MSDDVASHYAPDDGGILVDLISERLRRAGLPQSGLPTTVLAPLDEFHLRGREATLEVGAGLGVGAGDRVLDLGSGLGGPARTLAETYGCDVTGIDLTPAFSEAAADLSRRVGLDGKTSFQTGDATALPFADARFDAAITVHVAMNIAAKDRLYAEARRVLKAGGRFSIYDILRGDGGEPHFPVPWARDASLSHLATPSEMQDLLAQAGFALDEVDESTDRSLGWLEARLRKAAEQGPPPLTFALFLGADFQAMMANLRRNLAEHRVRTVRYLCRA